MKWPALGFVVSALTVSGCVRENVVRVFDGREVGGRWVSAEAYAAFTEASLEESRGNRAAAAAAYERAVAEDPKNALAWGRLGVLRCTADPAAADSAFSRAEALEPDLESPWIARAECALGRRDARSAAAYARKAAELSPADHEASSLLATALERSGDALGARRWRRGMDLVSGPAGEPTWPRHYSTTRETLERALDDADSMAIERAAVSARIGTAELSLRAVRRGRVELASELATRVLEADPRESDARIAALSSADLGRDEEAFIRWSKAVPAGQNPPSPLGAEVMEELIGRRVGPDMARAWASAYRAATTP